MDQGQKNKRNSYKKITQQVRQAIIDRILNNGENIKQVSNQMNVNISTCKAILKVYQEEGRIGKKKKRNKVVDVIETFSFFCMNDGNFDQVETIKIQQSKLSLKRNQNLDKTLEDNARAKAQKMLDGIIENKKKLQQTAFQMQRQIEQMRLMHMNYNPYYATINPFMLNHALMHPLIPPSSNQYTNPHSNIQDNKD